MTQAAQRFDVVIVGGGMVGTACALALARCALRVAVVERGPIGGGATAAGMGHLVVLDGSEAQFALCQRSLDLWRQARASLPLSAEYRTAGTVWVATDAEEMAEAERKQQYLEARAVSSRLLSHQSLAGLEPNLRAGLEGGLLVPEDAIVFPPVAAQSLLEQAQALGAVLIRGEVVQLAHGVALLSDGTALHADRLVNAAGADAPFCTPGLPIRKRKGHLAITDRYPGFLHHQIVELGYCKSAHSLTTDSAACNVQPRPTGQILIGSSRQFDSEDAAVEHAMMSRVLRRALEFFPGLAQCNVLRSWTGFRAATPDKLPLIGPDPHDATLWMATGHEGLGITTALATAELLAAILAGSTTTLDPAPYMPARFSAQQQKLEILEETV